MTTYRCDTSSRLIEIDQPSGETITFGYDPSGGQRDQKTVTTAGPNPTTYQVNDTYQNGELAAQTTLGGTLLATFTYDPAGVPESVVVGPNATTSPRYYYVYNGHGDVVALTDSSGNVVASYSYDVWGNLLSASESIPNANGWTNPYRYDGKDGARYDTETGLYWLSTRAYDPTLGRFLQRDPLGRAPLFFADQPYAYAGNNPLINVDPTGARYYDGEPETAQQQIAETRRTQEVMRMMPRQPWHPIDPPQSKTNSPKPTTAPAPDPCPQSCRDDKTSDGIKHIILGLVVAVPAFASMAAACWIGAACAAWFDFASPIFLQGVHWLLDGIDTLHQLAGNAVGDTLTLLVRGGRVGVDVLQILLAVTDVFASLGKFKAAWRALGSLKKVLVEALSQAPSKSAIGAAMGDLVGIAGSTLDITSDVEALNETLLARGL